MSTHTRGAPAGEEELVLLIRGAQSGEVEAWDALYLIYADRIYRFLLARSGDVGQAEELTSLVFLRLVERIGQYRIAPRDNSAIFSAWLFRIARNRSVDLFRSRRRARQVPLEQADRIPVSDQPMREAETRLALGPILQALKSLSDLQRDVIVLRFFEERTIAETAHLLDRSEGAIKSLQHRALAALRRTISTEVATE